MNKMIKIILFYVIFTLTLIVYFVFHSSSIRLEHGIYMKSPELVPHFELINHQGNKFNENNLKDHWTLLFFGFSSCEMICPLTLNVFNEVYERFPKTKRLQVIFISVDPEHDSLQRLNQFMHHFNDDFIALRGQMPEINTLQKQLHVTVSSTPMSHGTEILLINPEAKVQAYFYYPIAAKDLLLDMQHLIN